MWILAACLLFVSVAASEWVWRERGFAANVIDTPALWSVHRGRVYAGGDRRPIVLVGSSRAQQGVDPQVLSEALGGTNVVSLCLAGAKPWVVIEDLCADEEFDGIVVVSTVIPMLTPSTDGGASRRVELFQRDFRRPTTAIDRRLHAIISAELQSRLAVLSHPVSLRELISTHFKPQPMHNQMRANRHRPGHYRSRLTSVELGKLERKWVENLHKQVADGVDQETFATTVGAPLKALHDQLRARGGRMVLVRMPTSGRLWAESEALAPKAMYWDRLEALTGIPTIHFRDYGDLASFDCPDGSHVDASDAPILTRRLAKRIRGKLALPD
ncbi:MAG: hypothetical protein CMJ49_04635 [Planctomycetaceae bacterium]|nr:hypothetical protein [Planctomycetaceae bacterium]